MQQDQRLAFTLFDVMAPEGPHFNELPYRRVVTLCPFRNEAVDQRGYDEGCDDCCARSGRMRRVRGGLSSGKPAGLIYWAAQLEILCDRVLAEAGILRTMLLHCNTATSHPTLRSQIGPPRSRDHLGAELWAPMM
jgi:hypothetical protein